MLTQQIGTMSLHSGLSFKYSGLSFKSSHMAFVYLARKSFLNNGNTKHTLLPYYDCRSLCQTTNNWWCDRIDKKNKMDESHDSLQRPH